MQTSLLIVSQINVTEYDSDNWLEKEKTTLAATWNLLAFKMTQIIYLVLANTYMLQAEKYNHQKYQHPLIGIWNCCWDGFINKYDPLPFRFNPIVQYMQSSI